MVLHELQDIKSISKRKQTKSMDETYGVEIVMQPGRSLLEDVTGRRGDCPETCNPVAES